MLYFAFSLAAVMAPTARRPRAAQSAAAAALLSSLRARAGLWAGPSSKSHSRAACAAAVVADGPVGIDVEFACPSRDRAGMARFLLDEAQEPSLRDLYRLWTFREAYFKAFGAMPGARLLHHAHQAIAANPDGYHLEGFAVRHLEIAAAFQLTVIWNGRTAATPIAL